MTLEVVEIIKEVPPEKVCALPLAYHTTKTEPVVFDLTDKCCADNNPVYPHGVDAFYFSEVKIAKFTKQCVELGLQYIGIIMLWEHRQLHQRDGGDPWQEASR